MKRLSLIPPAALVFLLWLSPVLATDMPPLWDPEAATALTAHTMERIAGDHLNQDTPDTGQAALWLRAAAESGSASAMSHLAWLYQEGIGVERDGERALHWYARAVRAGEIRHSLTLGWAYLRGELVAPDRDRAEMWFREGIAADFHPARIALASLLIADATGGRAPERALEAEGLLKQALDHETELASYFLARLYLEGIGQVHHDPARGARFTRMGAERGNARMQAWLARIYADGEGVEQDLAEAVKWSSLAAAAGDAYGDRLRLRLEQDAAPGVVSEGRRRALEWIRQHAT